MIRRMSFHMVGLVFRGFLTATDASGCRCPYTLALMAIGSMSYSARVLLGSTRVRVLVRHRGAPSPLSRDAPTLCVRASL